MIGRLRNSQRLPTHRFIHAVLLGLFFPASPALVFAIEPEGISFDAHVNEPVMLSVQADVGKVSPMSFTADLEGFKGDRRIISKGAGKYEIEVAPDTLTSGVVHGSVVLRADGKEIGSAVQISGTIQPWIRIRPIRLFIGSVGQGKKFSAPQAYSVTLSSKQPFDIEHIDFEGIVGATWKCEPRQGEPSLTKNLQLSFSGDALAAGFPYGALVTKYIQIRTSDVRARALTIPVLGMLSINTTGRDYSQYLYQGQMRWQGIWSTPNVAAALLAPLLILICGAGCALHHAFTARRGLQIALAVIVFIAMGIGSHYLALTYSRGGWVATAIGISLLVIGVRAARFYPMGLAGMLALAIFLLPAGASRTLSSGMLAQDKSISHRLLVWKGALQMMAEHPWKGVGAGKFGDIFVQDYQLPTHVAEYSTALNDYLTFGAERGALLFAATFAGIVMLLAASFSLGFRRNPFLISCTAATFAALICGWFSSLLFFRDTSAFLGACAIATLAACAWQCWRDRIAAMRLLSRLVAGYVVVVAFVLAAIYIASSMAMRERPNVDPLQVGNFNGFRITPRSGATKGVLLYVGTPDDTLKLLLRSTLRPLAQNGWEVLYFPPRQYPSDTCDATIRVLEILQQQDQLKNGYRIAGHGSGAVVALSIAARANTPPKAIACYLMPSVSAFENMNPQAQVQRLASPLLIGTQKASPAQFALSSGTPSSLPFPRSTVLHAGTFGLSSAHWQEWITDLEKFLSETPSGITTAPQS